MKLQLPNKLITLDKLHSIVTNLKEQQKKVIWTNGCFDILHIGHIEYLNQAKMLGDILIVGLNSDDSVNAIKGNNRPLFNELDRAKVLNALVYIDYITIFKEPSPLKILQLLKPDYYVKGGDYTIDTINQLERSVIESYGGKIKILPIVQGVSTTEIVAKIQRLENIY